MKVLITGVAGFIGMHVAHKILEQGYEVIGIDNLNPYYDINLKISRLQKLQTSKRFTFFKGDMSEKSFLDKIFLEQRPMKVVNLGAQPGVRYSISNPEVYVQSNIIGFVNVLECCRHFGVEHLIYASSSSVYGQSKIMPLSEADPANCPVSLYAATKKSNEIMAYAYSSLYNFRTTGLRYFTVYGPWGRPDMSPWIFTRSIISGNKIQVFNLGKMVRDFTYIDDIVQATIKLMNINDVCEEKINFDSDEKALNQLSQVFNVGGSTPIPLMKFIETLESKIGIRAIVEYLPMQLGDVVETFADVKKLNSYIGFVPSTSLDEGISEWITWYKWYNS